MDSIYLLYENPIEFSFNIEIYAGFNPRYCQVTSLRPEPELPIPFIEAFGDINNIWPETLPPPLANNDNEKNIINKINIILLNIIL